MLYQVDPEPECFLWNESNMNETFWGSRPEIITTNVLVRGANLGECKDHEDDDAVAAHGHGLDEPHPAVHSP